MKGQIPIRSGDWEKLSPLGPKDSALLRWGAFIDFHPNSSSSSQDSAPLLAPFSLPSQGSSYLEPRVQTGYSTKLGVPTQSLSSLINIHAGERQREVRDKRREGGRTNARVYKHISAGQYFYYVRVKCKNVTFGLCVEENVLRSFSVQFATK